MTPSPTLSPARVTDLDAAVERVREALASDGRLLFDAEHLVRRCLWHFGQKASDGVIRTQALKLVASLPALSLQTLEGKL